MLLCVAIAPVPALAQGTTAPTARYFDATATPHSLRSGSWATMEKVFTCAGGAAGSAGEEVSGSARAVPARTANRTRKARIDRFMSAAPAQGNPFYRFANG